VTKPNLKNPLVVFDLETTGTSVTTDRIIEAALIKIHPNGNEERQHYLINPEINISKESSSIHGITNEMVKDKPTFREIAKPLLKFLEGCDLSGFNVIKFDLPILVEEFLRINIEFDISKRKLIDVQRVFHMMEKRTLGAAYKFYCDKDLKNAHSADADTEATWEVLKAQIEKYDGQPVFDNLGNEIGQITNNMDSLHELGSRNMIDLAGRMVYNDKGEEVINFGKHKGRLVSDVLESEPSYYDWIMKGEFPLDTKRKLTSIKLRAFQK